jgi:hypothetical protein
MLHTEHDFRKHPIIPDCNVSSGKHAFNCVFLEEKSHQVAGFL